MPPTSESNVRPVGTVHACNHRAHPSDQLPDVAIMAGNNAALVLAKDSSDKFLGIAKRLDNLDETSCCSER
jgi:hypothetical protein